MDGPISSVLCFSLLRPLCRNQLGVSVGQFHNQIAFPTPFHRLHHLERLVEEGILRDGNAHALYDTSIQYLILLVSV
jgi:hypothetical protein